MSGYIAAIGTPQQAAKLTEIERDNAAIVGAAPSELRDALATINEASALARKVQGAQSSADRIAASKAAAEAASSAKFKTASADYTAWVRNHCGALATKILTAGT